MTITELKDRAVLRVEGTDATHFLQNLVTCDVEGLSAGEATFGALLTPQGKILFDFFILRTDAAYLLDTSAARADDLLKRLTFYRLRADVKIEPAGLVVTVGWDAQAPSDAFADPRLPELGWRALKGEVADGDAAQWHARRIALGVPELLADFEPETTFPHEALMDQFASGGVAFTKGCYVGQEVVSRMQHRGTARSRYVKVAGSSTLPARGADLTAADRKIGAMGGSQGADGLALVRLDRAARAIAEGVQIEAGSIPVALSLPEFVTFAWPASASVGEADDA